MEKEKERELVELYDKAKKAADAARSDDGGPNQESRCIDALEQLKKFPVNYKILVNTQVLFFFFLGQIFVFYCFCFDVLLLLLLLFDELKLIDLIFY